MVLLSIIVGLGVTELLTNVAGMIKNRKTITFSWIHTLMCVVVFVGFIQQWWESWGLQTVQNWNFLNLLMMLGAPICLFVMSHLLFPDQKDNVDLETHYYDNSRAFWIVATIAVTVSTLFRPLNFDIDLVHPDNATSAILFLAFVSMAVTRNRRWHSVAVPVTGVAAATDILVFSLRI